ncbi:uncharacterized protein METZ01_LOCUS101543 [marine metagenome]|uniref:Uncharacterized protein n=1 Tax=marine metagenome TaxID=408172 RepID=A0A381W818_9ZZZZ
MENKKVDGSIIIIVLGRRNLTLILRMGKDMD